MTSLMHTLKIAEGRDNHCTVLRYSKFEGAYRSRTIESIAKEAKSPAKQNKKEIVLVAQDVTNYGTDNYGEKKLVALIQELSKIEDTEFSDKASLLLPRTNR